MSRASRNRKILATTSVFAVTALALVGCGPAGGGNDEGPVELTIFSGSGVQTNDDIANSLAAAFEAENPDITIKLDNSGGSGADLENLIKTRLATGEMADMFMYPSGSLLAALNPDQTLYNFGAQDWTGNLDQSFIKVVSGKDDAVFGAPFTGADIGGILYNKPLYAKLGLEVPKTWDEFLANNEAIKKAGITGTFQTFGDSWTAQLLQLGDYYNIYEADPNWADEFTANKAKFATTPEGVKSFEKMQDLYDGGYLNPDAASALLNDGLTAVATGTAGHYPMFAGLYSALTEIAPDNIEDLGIFGVPGDDPDKAGATVWLPGAFYAPANTKHPEAVAKWMAFVASPDGCAAIQSAASTGPLLVKGCTFPDDSPSVLKDIVPYLDEEKTSPALEFLSPVKGTNLAAYLVEVGLGTRTGEDAAAAYDQDVEKAAQQLGLPGW